MHFFSVSFGDAIWISIFSFIGAPSLYEILKSQELINYKPIRYYKTYIVLLIFLFTLIDINYLNIINSNNVFDIVVINLFSVLIANSFLSYISLKAGLKGTILYSLITIMPTFIFSVVPKYNSFIILLFNLIFYLITYVFIQYNIDKNSKELYQKSKFINIKRMIVSFIILFILIIFSIGALPIKPVVILSGSMKPIINEGDLAIIKKTNINKLKVGDIIEYKFDDYSVVHRIISINIKDNQKYIITKGDNNDKPDKYPILEYQIIGKMEILIPYIGYPTYLLKNIGNK
jgi:signal peptidase